jgi:hypothetical protein
VALRGETLTSEQLNRQRALDRSWTAAQRDLADPEFRARLEAVIRRIDDGEPAPRLSREEFLGLTKDLDEV